VSPVLTLTESIGAAGAAAADALADDGAPRVVSIFVAPRKGAAMRVLDQVLAVPGRGLQGDRYWDAPRRSTPASGGASAVTLIEAEALDALEREHGIHLAPADTRRNLLTRSLALNELVGREFRVGEVVLRGIALCDPCLNLEQATRAGVLRGLVRRGGLRAEIVVGGTIRSGDPAWAGF
jgi:MOSC domain-containing protein YiiM